MISQSRHVNWWGLLLGPEWWELVQMLCVGSQLEQAAPGHQTLVWWFLKSIIERSEREDNKITTSWMFWGEIKQVSLVIRINSDRCLKRLFIHSISQFSPWQQAARVSDGVNQTDLKCRNSDSEDILWREIYIVLVTQIPDNIEQQSSVLINNWVQYI